jgi:hypothetical protein
VEETCAATIDRGIIANVDRSRIAFLALMAEI